MNEETRLRRELARFQAPALRKSLSQLATSMGGFLATCAAMYAVLDVYRVVLALVPLAAGFLVRIFIIQLGYDRVAAVQFPVLAVASIIGKRCLRHLQLAGAARTRHSWSRPSM